MKFNYFGSEFEIESPTSTPTIKKARKYELLDYEFY